MLYSWRLSLASERVGEGDEDEDEDDDEEEEALGLGGGVNSVRAGFSYSSINFVRHEKL